MRTLTPEFEAADGTPAAAVLIGENANEVLARDAQVAQNMPTSGSLANSAPFLDTLAKSPATGCSSIMDQARIESGFNPLTPGQVENPAALIAYVSRLLEEQPLLQRQLFDRQEVHRKDDDWNQVIAEIAALYPVQSAAQRQSISNSLVGLIEAGLNLGGDSGLIRHELFSQHTIETGSKLTIYIYLSMVQFTKQKDGKDTTRQVDFIIHRAIINFQVQLWDRSWAERIAKRHYKSLVDWLAGMNSSVDPRLAAISCFSKPARRMP